MDIKYVKGEKPIDLAEYAVANQISDDPAFDWWVPYNLNKRNRIISRFKEKYWRKTHKYGVSMTNNSTEAM